MATLYVFHNRSHTLNVHVFNPCHLMLAKADYFFMLCVPEKACPAGWRRFMCSCYLLSSESGSWTRGGQDCTNRGAHLVIIDSTEEQVLCVHPVGVGGC